MGVYVRGMEMPTSCRDCDFMNWGAVEPNRCGITDCFIGGDYDKRHDNCPLFPVPPHGRLIDAVALIEESGLSTSPDSCEGCQHKNGNRCDGEWAMLCEALSDAPTIIEAEEGET